MSLPEASQIQAEEHGLGIHPHSSSCSRSPALGQFLLISLATVGH